MNYDTMLEIMPFAWPLIIVLILLVILRKIENTVNPIIAGVVSGMAVQAQKNALGYGLAIGYGLSASLQALAEQATILHWVIIAAMAKVLNPFIVAMLAYAANNEIAKKAPAANKSAETQPPFPNP